MNDTGPNTDAVFLGTGLERRFFLEAAFEVVVAALSKRAEWARVALKTPPSEQTQNSALEKKPRKKAHTQQSHVWTCTLASRLKKEKMMM